MIYYTYLETDGKLLKRVLERQGLIKMVLSQKAKNYQNFLKQFNYSFSVIELPNSTRTSIEAAKAVGCSVGQIAKSLVFRGKKTDSPYLIIASGSNRVDEKKMAMIIGEPIEKADADFVKNRTGFVIGGVPPVGHLKPLDTFIDQDLLKNREIWAAAGTPHAVFKLTPQDLLKIAKGKIIKIT